LGSSTYLDSGSKQPTCRSEAVRSRLLTPEEVAEQLGVSTETLAQWRSQQRGIPYVKISRYCIRYRALDLELWLEERTVHVPAEPLSAKRRN
jgi:excisionase family DNA binding protein